MRADAYALAGVDIAAGDEAVRRIAPHVERTRRPEVLGGLGGFGAACALDTDRYREPVLVSATDGVGTKLKVAALAERWDTVGIDLVAMCVNDIATSGAEPLFFLDYLATSKLSAAVAEQLVRGIADGCLEAGCALIGGETAELPGVYQRGDVDLAGFTVGVVERSRMLSRSSVMDGDALIGIASSGLHSNGYSLVRKLLLDELAMELSAYVPELGRTLVDELLEPTRIYVRLVQRMLEELPVRTIAHITGGGLVENVPRMLPDGLGARIRMGSWDVPPIFDLLCDAGDLSAHDAHRTFNMGVGLVVAVPADHAQQTLDWLRERQESAWWIGQVVAGLDGVELTR